MEHCLCFQCNPIPTEPRLRTFDSRLQGRIKVLTQSVHGKDMLPLYQPPAKYTGELFGVEYLYHQSGQTFSSTAEELDQQINEGFEDIGDDVDQHVGSLVVDDGDPTVDPPVDQSDSSEDGDEVGLQTLFHSVQSSGCGWFC